MLADFGISRIIEESVTVSGTSSLRGNIRWMSIELLDPRILNESNTKHEFHTKQSDVWAYGMVLYVSTQYWLTFSVFIDRIIGNTYRRVPIYGEGE